MRFLTLNSTLRIAFTNDHILSVRKQKQPIKQTTYMRPQVLVYFISKLFPQHVIQGYIDIQALTTHKFIPHPASSTPKCRRQSSLQTPQPYISFQSLTPAVQHSFIYCLDRVAAIDSFIYSLQQQKNTNNTSCAESSRSANRLFSISDSSIVS